MQIERRMQDAGCRKDAAGCRGYIRSSFVSWCLGGYVSLFVCCVAFCGYAFASDVSNGVVRHIQWSFTLQSSRDVMLSAAELWTYAPVKLTSHQFCTNITASHAFNLCEDALGNQIVYFSIANIPPYGTKIVRITADVVMRSAPEKTVEPDARHLLAEPLIEINNPEFVKLAPKFTGVTGTQLVARIFSFVAGKVNGSYEKSARGALYALKTGSGDCTEHAALFVALCRLNKIPARWMSGQVCPANTILSPAQYHDWAEFYMDGAWHVADTQKGVFMTKEDEYVAMRIVGQAENDMKGHPRYRFSGEGLDVRMNP